MFFIIIKDVTMNFKYVLIFIPLIAFTDAAYSESPTNNFSVKLGYGLANYHNEAIWTYADESAKDGQMALTVIGYTKQFEGFNLTGELFTFVGPSDSGSYSEYNTVYKTSNIWGFNLNPEFKINAESVGYLKIGYAFAKSQQADNYGYVDYGSIQGGLFGLGVKLPIAKDVFIGLESFRIGFSRTGPAYSSGWSRYTTNKSTVTFSSVYISKYF
jgi:hypothetical protein